MVRTQIQLPDELYQKLKALAEDREWSLAEAVRRATEQFLQRYPSRRTRRGGWQLPEPLPLGRFQAPVDRWRELANEPLPAPAPGPKR